MLPRHDELGEDGDLLARLARRDVDALAALYDRHAALAYGLARRVLGEGEAAEAVVAAVFLAIWGQTARYDPACGWSIPTWLGWLVRTCAFARQPAARNERAAP